MERAGTYVEIGGLEQMMVDSVEGLGGERG